jgi:plastocyanin
MIALMVAALAVVAVGAIAGVGFARSSQTKVVKVADDFFSPGRVSIHKYDKVKWKWTPVFNNHNVTLKSAPRGVRKSRFRSQTTSNPDYRFTRKFRKPGTYRFICTIHPTQMKVKVVVHRPPRH